MSSDLSRERTAESLFATWLEQLEPGADVDIEALYREHAPLAPRLRVLYGRWLRFRDAWPTGAGPRRSDSERPATSRGLERSVRERLLELEPRRPDCERYEVEDEVGRGGMGAVLQVWDRCLRRHLAMKVMLEHRAVTPGNTPSADPRLLSRFLDEAQVTGQLDHPGIVPVHELGLDAEGHVYFTMKLVEGTTLREVFEEHARGEAGWTHVRVLGLVQRVCDAMSYAHAKGIVHRDLKPANVMVGRYGETYVMDWGLAHQAGQEGGRDIRPCPELESPESAQAEPGAIAEGCDGSSSSPDLSLRTMEGDVVGTPAYMPPEQARGDLAAMGAHSDVYAVGAMLYHLLSGGMPYARPGERLDNHEMWKRVQQGPPRPLRVAAPSAPAELAAICEKAMAREPGERYADMPALASDLSAYVEGRVVAAYETGAWAEARKWVRRNQRFAGALAAAIVLLVVGLVTALVLQERAAQQEALAKRNEEVARRRAEDVLSLSAFRSLDHLEEEASRLWPPHPEHLQAYDDWIREAQKLVAGLDPDPVSGDAGHRARLKELRARALRRSPAERERDRTSDPSYPDLLRLQAQIASIRRELAIDDGAPPVEAQLSPEDQELEAAVANELAWSLVGADREDFGDEARGLALARANVERAQGSRQTARFRDTLARAFLANGQYEEAQRWSAEALAAAPPEDHGEFAGYSSELEDRIAAARSGVLLREKEAALAELDREVESRRSWRFAANVDAWWHEQLDRLIRELEILQDSEVGLWKGETVENGWGIEHRRAVAAEVQRLTLTGPRAVARWAAAAERVAASSVYRGMALVPQAGLVPLGPDPDSGLEEFGHPVTGTIPERDGAGRLTVGEETGLVFVLLPSGTFLMGAQRLDPEGPNHDPRALSDESPVRRVSLSAFFLSKYEMTQGQWARFALDRPARNGPMNPDRLSRPLLHPVEDVSWARCSETCERLGLRLPSEAEWEYAIRGGTSTPWWTGSSPETLVGAANLADLSLREVDGGRRIHAWLTDGAAGHAPVGEYAPNPFGLHDVCGNVKEWCIDYFRPYSSTPETDPVADEALWRRGFIRRGGSYYELANFARSAFRNNWAHAGFTDTGLRPARALRVP